MDIILETIMGNFDNVSHLLDTGADINTRSKTTDYTPLHYACSKGDTKIVRLLIDRGVDVNACDKYSTTPLILAIENNNLEIVRLLLEHGADVNPYYKDSRIPLITASIYGNLDIVQLLLDYGADVNARNTFTGETALIFAYKNNHIDIVKILIKYGSNPKIPDIDNNSVFNDSYVEDRYGNLYLRTPDDPILKMILDYQYNK